MAIEGLRGVVDLLVVVLHVLLLEVLPLALRGVSADGQNDGVRRRLFRRTPLLMLFQTLAAALSKALRTS